jgi:hypothetical protein
MSVVSRPQFVTSPSRYRPISQQGTLENTANSAEDESDEPVPCMLKNCINHPKLSVAMRNFSSTMHQFLRREGVQPNSDHRRELHRLSVLASIAVVFFAPPLATFDMRNNAPKVGWAAMVIVHTIADLILICESISCAITGSYMPNDKGEKCKLVNTVGENVNRYLRSYFILDFVTSFPVIRRII